MAELGVLMPRSGGQYVFARTVFGPYAGFVVGWSDWVSSCASAAAVSMAVAEYAGVFVSTDVAIVTLLALGIVLVFTALLWKGVKSSGRTVEVMTLAKVIVLVGVPLVAFATGVRAPIATTAAADVGALTVGSIILAMQSVIYSYDGWTGVLYFSGEVKDPARDIPRSMFGGVVSVFAIYMLLVGCFVYVFSASAEWAPTTSPPARSRAPSSATPAAPSSASPSSSRA
jgi:amino acid transporter